VSIIIVDPMSRTVPIIDIVWIVPSGLTYSIPAERIKIESIRVANAWTDIDKIAIPSVPNVPPQVRATPTFHRNVGRPPEQG
jgi:hypothetical protein